MRSEQKAFEAVRATSTALLLPRHKPRVLLCLQATEGESPPHRTLRSSPTASRCVSEELQSHLKPVPQNPQRRAGPPATGHVQLGGVLVGQIRDLRGGTVSNHPQEEEIKASSVRRAAALMLSSATKTSENVTGCAICCPQMMANFIQTLCRGDESWFNGQQRTSTGLLAHPVRPEVNLSPQESKAARPGTSRKQLAEDFAGLLFYLHLVWQRTSGKLGLM